MNIAAEKRLSAEELMEPYRLQIERALKYTRGTHIWADLVKGVRDAEMHFWPAEKSFLITEIMVFPQKRSLHVFLAGGDLDEIMEMRPSVEDFARRLECDFVTLAGRLGWKKVLSDNGYEASWTYMAKDVSSGKRRTKS